MSKICKNCGTELGDEFVICTNCGADVSEVESAEVEKKDIAEEVTEKINDVAEKLKGDKKLLGIAIGGVVALVVVIALLFTFVFGSGYKKAIDNYIKFMGEGNAKVISKMIPADALKYLEDEEDFDLDEYKEQYEEMYESRLESLEDEYGKNIRFSYKVTDKDELSEKKLNALRDNLKDNYDIAKKDVKKAYEVELELTIKGKDDKDTNDAELIVVKIGGSWYVCSSGGSFYVGF